jgi:predicted ester cyclase
MWRIRNLIAAASLCVIGFAQAAQADDLASVQTFYDLLSNPGSEVHVTAFRDVTSDAWESVGDYSGKNKPRAAFLGQMGHFAKLIPDLDWAVQAMHQDGAFVIVRSRATGTPTGPLFGVDGQGRSFDIMTIDIHEVQDDKIIRTYHVEDWASALRQLAGK